MADRYRVIEVKEGVLSDNERRADALREELRSKGTYLINLMSSPGSGKTTTLKSTIAALGQEMSIAVMEADVDSDVDAAAIDAAGARTIQLHTGGMCHLDAKMCADGLSAMGDEGLDLVFIENVGNLICPAEFDTGAAAKVAILSVPEGDDKPLKYPLMFEVCDVVLVNKIDVLPYFDFDLSRFAKNVHDRNPNSLILPVSAKTGEGMDAWFNWLRSRVTDWKQA